MSDKPKMSLLERYLTAIVFAACMIVFIGSGLTGARVITIVYRCTVVFFILSVTRRILLKAWLSWQETMRGAADGAKAS